MDTSGIRARAIGQGSAMRAKPEVTLRHVRPGSYELCAAPWIFGRLASTSA